MGSDCGWIPFHTAQVKTKPVGLVLSSRASRLLHRQYVRVKNSDRLGVRRHVARSARKGPYHLLPMALTYLERTARHSS